MELKIILLIAFVFWLFSLAVTSRPVECNKEGFNQKINFGPALSSKERISYSLGNTGKSDLEIAMTKMKDFALRPDYDEECNFKMHNYPYRA